MSKKTALIRLCKLLPSARDIIGDEELDDDFEPPLPSAVTISKSDGSNVSAAAPTAQQSADQLGRQDSFELHTEGATDGGGRTEPSASPNDKSASFVSSSAPAEKPAAAASPPPPSDPGGLQGATGPTSRPAPPPRGGESFAYQRGKETAEKKGRRAAIPREYCDGKHDHLVSAWLAGFDGQELPTQQPTTEVKQ